MIIATGYIRVISEQGGGFDEKGNPIEVSQELGHPIPCNFQRNDYRGRGIYEGGQYTSASYTILIDVQDFHPCRIKLYNLRGDCLGEYEVQQKGIVDLWEVGNTQLTV